MTNAELQIAIDAIRNATADGSITNVMEADIMDALKSNNIPLSGTTEGNPVTGDIEVIETSKGFWKKAGNYDVDGDYYGLLFSEGGVSINYNNPTNPSLNKSLSISQEGYILGDDISDVNPTNKLIYAQRSYTERPETLITALTNCDSTQLDEIKTILGII